MADHFQTVQSRNFISDNLVSLKRDLTNDAHRFDFLEEPRKFSSFGETTYADHFGPKTNLPPAIEIIGEGPILTPLSSERAKHLVSTTQFDFDGKRFGSYSGNQFLKESCKCHRAQDEFSKMKSDVFGNPSDILTTIGPIPLMKTCRRVQRWDTTYGTDYIFVPPAERKFPFSG
ncbi:uncharacterized protein LOC129223195 [Uloborus diversus]|uniref:uncharacterized protein LOC129223195 n=1 Tax=Uloborus diversus TaxID=327109 RepID=UPI002409E3C9|nr:uncharacterized protein LOC129223195 [Uloborus diversus]